MSGSKEDASQATTSTTDSRKRKAKRPSFSSAQEASMVLLTALKKSARVSERQRTLWEGEEAKGEKVSSVQRLDEASA